MPRAPIPVAGAEDGDADGKARPAYLGERGAVATRGPHDHLESVEPASVSGAGDIPRKSAVSTDAAPRCRVVATALFGMALSACGARHVAGPPLAVPPSPSTSFRLRLCSEAPVRLAGHPGARQSRGCVVTFTQALSDPATIRALGTDKVQRRYLVYAPTNLPLGPAPVVLMFPGYSANAEAAAFYYTQTRFETLADRDGFIVVYGNGLPYEPNPREKPSMPKGGFLRGCMAPHGGEGIDVQYVRQILAQVATELTIDRARVYATGLSAGGGMSFQLALEAPDLVAAIAPGAPIPYQPGTHWLLGCHPRPGHEAISIAMVGATDDPFISYAPGGSREYPGTQYPGMEATRDAWLAAMGLSGPPEVDAFPDVVHGDSFQPQTGRASSTIERQRYRPGPDGRELWYYKAHGMGHWWPNPTQSWGGLWAKYGKTNQDIDFADHAWEFFRRHVKR